MKTKTLLTFLVWMSGLGVFGYLGWKMIMATGAGVAYDYIAKELDSGETCAMEDANGKTIFVRKVDRNSQ